MRFSTWSSAIALGIVFAMGCRPLFAFEAAPCGARFEVVQRHFQKINHPAFEGLYFYTGDIHSSVMGFSPFDLFLVSGKVYPPFSKDKGRLKEPDFFNLFKNDQAFTVTPLRISHPQGSVKFSVQGAAFTVNYSVKPAWFADDKIQVQVCKDPP
jgi:hypothetical protein